MGGWWCVWWGGCGARVCYLAGRLQQVLANAAARAMGPGSGEDDALSLATEALAPKPPGETACTTCVYQWRYDDGSLWNGYPDNSKLARLARSMLSVGFKQDEPINARDLDLTAPDAHRPNIATARLRFGDGSARGLALKWAWSLFLKYALDPEMPWSNRMSPRHPSELRAVAVPPRHSMRPSSGPQVRQRAVAVPPRHSMRRTPGTRTQAPSHRVVNFLAKFGGKSVRKITFTSESSPMRQQATQAV